MSIGAINVLKRRVPDLPRILRCTTACLVVMSGAEAAEIGLGKSLKKVQPPQSTTPRGKPLDLNRHCVAKLGKGARALVKDARDAFTWRCARSSTERSIDMNEACRQQYGLTAHASLGARSDPFSWSCLDTDGIGTSTQELKEDSLVLALEQVFPLTFGPDGRRVTFSRPRLTVFTVDKVEFRTRIKYRKTRGVPQYTASGKSLIKGNLLWGPGFACVSRIRVKKVNLRGISDLLDKHYFKGELNEQLRKVCYGRVCYDPEEPPKPSKQSKHSSYPDTHGKYDSRDPYATLRLAAQNRPSFCLPTTPRDRVPGN